jgi:hypothetical protein
MQVSQGPGRPASHIVLRAERDPAFRKPARLGGYRHKGTGALYLHAATQTPRPLDAATHRAPRMTRDAQTVAVLTRSTQSLREFGTQMAGPGVLLDTSADRAVTPGDYFTAEQRERSDSEP